MSLFPMYDSHEEVRCFNCTKLLDDDPQQTGYPHTSGEFSQQCTVCRVHTVYDLTPAPLRVGDVVLWRGSWGSDVRRHAVVTDLEQTSEPNEKYGERVDSLDWARVQAGFAVVTLDNGHWAYGHQLEPLTRDGCDNRTISHEQ